MAQVYKTISPAKLQKELLALEQKITRELKGIDGGLFTDLPADFTQTFDGGAFTDPPSSFLNIVDGGGFL